jgi:hypothetical protein
VTKCAAYISEPVAVPSDKYNISTKQSAYQNIYFILLPYFVQNKYAPHTNNPPSSPQRTNSAHSGGAHHNLRNSELGRTRGVPEILERKLLLEIFIWKPEKRWEDDIKEHLTEIVCEYGG